MSTKKLMLLDCGAGENSWEFPEIVVLEKTLESPMRLWCWRKLLRVPWTVRRSNQSIPKENNPKYSLKGLMLEAEAPILWPPDAKSWLTGKDLDARKDWGQKEKRVTEDEMVRWHHQVNGHEFEQTLGDSGGQRSLVCWSPWSHRVVGHDLAAEQQQNSI